MLGAIEAGGTKFICAVGDMDFNVIELIEIPTTTPAETMVKVQEFFQQFEIQALGVGSFGPADINTNSASYGCITTTPKVKWQHFNILSC